MSVYFVLFAFIMVCILWSYFGEPTVFVRHIIEIATMLSSVTVGVVAICLHFY